MFSVLALLALVAVPQIESGRAETNSKTRDHYGGERDIGRDEYRLFLVNHAGIEHVETLGKYTARNRKVYSTLKDALEDADLEYSSEIRSLEHEPSQELNTKTRERKHLFYGIVFYSAITLLYVLFWKGPS
jgi:hypothetical protein